MEAFGDVHGVPSFNYQVRNLVLAVEWNFGLDIDQ
jgi:hypothetical protein